MKRLSSKAPIILLLIASLYPLWVAFQTHQFLNDDTYITLTYAKSLAAGRGFVFNHPPATLGTTTPLLTVIVAGLGVLFPWLDISIIAVIFTALCWIAVIWTIYLFRHHLDLTEWQATIIGLVIVASGWVGLLGMEAYLFAFLLVLNMALFFSRRWMLAGISTGLLFLTRGEGILVLLLLVGWYGVTEWLKVKKVNFQSVKPMFSVVGGFLIPTLIWASYAQLTFGAVLPNTLAAKKAQGESTIWRPFLTRLLQEWIPLWEQQFAHPRLPLLNLWWLLVVIGLGLVIIKKQKWLLLLLWIGLYTSGYTILGIAGYGWYQLPILFAAEILAALGLVWVAERLFNLNGKIHPIGQIVSVLIITIVLFLLIKPRVEATLNYTGDSRAPSYLAVAGWLRENTQSAQSAAYIEVGYLGYYTDNRIIDLAGLTMPDITPHIAKRDFAWGFWQYQPDYYVYLPDFDWALADIHADPRFGQLYKPVATLPGPRETDFVIYARTEN